MTAVAVLFALAVGVALGAGPLSARDRDDRPVSARVQQPVAAPQTTAYGDEFAAAVAPQLYADRLRGRAVAIVTLPGADPDVVGELGDQVAAAAGAVAGTYEVGVALTDANDKALVDTLGRRLAGQLAAGSLHGPDTTYVRAGELVGLAALGDGPPADVAAVRAALAGGDLLTSPARARPAPVVLVVLGDRTDPAILAGLVQGLTVQATGVVVAGDAAAATPTGDLGRLRSSPAADGAATVDGVDTPLGRVAAVLALERAFTSAGGSFGASGSDGPVPLK